MDVDFQLQIYFLAGVFGITCTILIFFIAALCGRLEKLKRENRQRDKHAAEYDNYAYNCPTIQPGEELNRRGYSMYSGSYGARQQTNQPQTVPLHIIGPAKNNLRSVDQQANTSFGKRPDTRVNGDGTRDASNDFSRIVSNETLVICSSETESLDKTNDINQFPPPPPPKVLRQVSVKTEGENLVN